MYIRVLKEIDFISFYLKKNLKILFFLLLSLSNLRFEEKKRYEKIDDCSVAISFIHLVCFSNRKRRVSFPYTYICYISQKNETFFNKNK